jgi:hypothetical protein
LLTDPPAESEARGDVDRLEAAWLGRDVAAALGETRALLTTGRAAEVRARAMRVCMMDGAVRAIVVAHLMKMTVAAFEEHAATGSALPVLALSRLLASRVQERRVAQLSFEALRLLREGKPPERLTG